MALLLTLGLVLAAVLILATGGFGFPFVLLAPIVGLFGYLVWRLIRRAFTAEGPTPLEPPRP